MASPFRQGPDVCSLRFENAGLALNFASFLRFKLERMIAGPFTPSPDRAVDVVQQYAAGSW